MFQVFRGQTCLTVLHVLVFRGQTCVTVLRVLVFRGQTPVHVQHVVLSRRLQGTDVYRCKHTTLQIKLRGLTSASAQHALDSPVQYSPDSPGDCMTSISASTARSR